MLPHTPQRTPPSWMSGAVRRDPVKGGQLADLGLWVRGAKSMWWGPPFLVKAPRAAWRQAQHTWNSG